MLPKGNCPCTCPGAADPDGVGVLEPPPTSTPTSEARVGLFSKLAVTPVWLVHVLAAGFPEPSTNLTTAHWIMATR